VLWIRIGFNADPDPDPAYLANADPDPIRIQGFDDEKLENFYRRKKIKIFNQKFQFTYP
jgi:hypothetical protein